MTVEPTPGVILSIVGIGVSILIALNNEWNWEEKADAMLMRNPLLADIGTYENLSMTRRVDLIRPTGPRRRGEDQQNVENYLLENHFKEPKICGWIKEKPFDDLDDFTTCYLRTVEFGNCDTIYLIAAKYNERQLLEELVASHFTLSIC